MINFDAPSTLETYLHRIGRTARAGNAGLSVTLAEDGDRKLVKDILNRWAGGPLERDLLSVCSL